MNIQTGDSEADESGSTLSSVLELTNSTSQCLLLNS